MPDPAPPAATWTRTAPARGSRSQLTSSAGTGIMDLSVMYEDGKILVMGGGDPPTNTVERIDLNAAAPAWQSAPSMNWARRQMGSTILPDGKVLVVGGSSSGGFNDATLAVLLAEIWDPVTNSWSRMASTQAPRMYHSDVLLLPDGRVVSAGGGRPAAINTTDQSNAQIVFTAVSLQDGRFSRGSAHYQFRSKRASLRAAVFDLHAKCRKRYPSSSHPARLVHTLLRRQPADQPPELYRPSWRTDRDASCQQQSLPARALYAVSSQQRHTFNSADRPHPVNRICGGFAGGARSAHSR